MKEEGSPSNEYAGQHIMKGSNLWFIVSSVNHICQSGYLPMILSFHERIEDQAHYVYLQTIPERVA